jgi:hypothetical protein
MTTNNQAALQAAATVFSEAKAYVRPETVTGMAWQFKLWLDRKDTEDEAKREQAETVSHHISCSSRIRVARFACDCAPVKYEDVAANAAAHPTPEMQQAGAEPQTPKPGPRVSGPHQPGCILLHPHTSDKCVSFK